jgi:uncharacterized damage-inducible protein DinB
MRDRPHVTTDGGGMSSRVVVAPVPHPLLMEIRLLKCASLLRVTALIVAASSPLGAQAHVDGPDLLIRSFHAGAAHVEQVFRTSAERMPAADYAFRPTPAVRSFAELVGHVAESNYVFCAIMKGETAPEKSIEWARLTKAEMQEALAESFTYCKDAIAAMDGPQAQVLVRFQGREWPAAAVMNFRNYHALLHYGNVITYLRLRGVVPPSTEP